MKKIAIFIISFVFSIFSLAFGFLPGASGMAFAESECNNTQLVMGLRPWYYGLNMTSSDKGGCSVNPDSVEGFLWKIISNIVFDLLVFAGVVCVGFIIYSGYLYVTSGGDAGKVAKAKKSLTATIIGLLIILLGQAIILFVIDNIMKV